MMRRMTHPGTIIARWMKEADIDEATLARAANMHQPTLWRIINGESRSPRRENLAKIARVFGRRVEDLYDDNAAPLIVEGQEQAAALAMLTERQRQIVTLLLEEFAQKR